MVRQERIAHSSLLVEKLSHTLDDVRAFGGCEVRKNREREHGSRAQITVAFVVHVRGRRE